MANDADNADDRFKSYNTAPGILQFPFLNKPRDFDNKGDFKYDTGFLLGGADAEEMKEAVATWVAEAATEHGAPVGDPPFEDHVDPDTKEPTGLTLFKFKVPAVTETKKGPWDRRPIFLDASATPIQGTYPSVGSGTRACLAFQVYKWKFGKKAGVTLQPTHVQILELVEFTGGGSPTGGLAAAEGSYEAPAAPPAPADGGFDNREHEEQLRAARQQQQQQQASPAADANANRRRF